MSLTDIEIAAMRAAIDAGKKCQGEDARVHPKVGAAIVREGHSVVTAFRGESGAGDHAEYALFEKLAGADLTGSTLYTTLEPCTQRKPPKMPCADRTVARGVARVVIGMFDPDPRIYSQGASSLRSRGVRVDFFPEDLEAELRTDNAAFIDQFHANPELSGEARFDYTRNDGNYVFGHHEWIFESHWTKCSNTCIYVYRQNNIRSVRIARGNTSLDQLPRPTLFDASSPEAPQTGEIVFLENSNGYFAALKICEIRVRERGDGHDSVRIQFRILTGPGDAF
jgi:diaminohydroxyphosphoribosylaminopyrimidine deaminase / 5-amino-6-(5-phosphoribosylamino)uracil reductase